MTTLTMQDEKRLEIIQRVLRRELTVMQAALVMGVSERQCYRIKAQVDKTGAKGVVHGNRGRPCKRKTKEKTIRQVLALARGKYQGFNDHHLTEKLKEQEKIKLSREKVRRVLRANGISSPKRRRGIKHRSRRERRASEGMMLQVDGSPHDWLQGRGSRLCLIGAIDDATSKVMGAFFAPADSSWLLSPVLRDLQAAWSAPVDLYRLSLGILYRPGTDVRGAVDQQKTDYRGGPRVRRAG